MSKKILIVEDELAYLKLFDSQLTERGFEVTVAVNGQEGLKLARQIKPDLIILDIRMPVMDGLTMLDLLRRAEGGNQTKVILLTNLEPDEDMISSVIRDQPTCYLIKSDIKLSELMNKAVELLGE